MEALCLPVRALARRASEGSGLERFETLPVELAGVGGRFRGGVGRQGVWVVGVIGGLREEFEMWEGVDFGEGD